MPELAVDTPLARPDLRSRDDIERGITRPSVVHFLDGSCKTAPALLALGRRVVAVDAEANRFYARFRS